jgi:LysM repeat protein
MKRLLLFPTCFLLVFLVAGCGVMEVSLMDPMANDVGPSDPFVDSTETPTTTNAHSFGEGTSENKSRTKLSKTASVTPPPGIDGLRGAPFEQKLEAQPSTPTIITNTNQQICNVRTNWPAYTVQYGDTLTFIAHQSNTTVATLVVANCLINPDRILVGQSIRIPHEITIIHSS